MTTKAGHWFHSKSPAAQRAYIASHPNSIYAKNARAGKVRRSPADYTKEEREAIRNRRAEHDSMRAKAWYEMQDRHNDPKAHAKRQKDREKNLNLYTSKVTSAAKKLDAAQAKVDKHTASGSRHLTAAKEALRKATRTHKGAVEYVKGLKKRIKEADTAHKDYHKKRSVGGKMKVPASELNAAAGVNRAARAQAK